MSKKNKNRVNKKRATSVVVGVPIEGRRKELSMPTKKFTVDEIFLSTVTIGFGQYMGYLKHKKDSTPKVPERYWGKEIVVTAEVGNFVREEGDGSYLGMVHPQLVGEKVGTVFRSVGDATGTVLSGVVDLPLKEFRFSKDVSNTKILLGVTIMFSIHVTEDGQLNLDRGIEIIDLGTKLFQEDGSIDELSKIGSIPTHNFEVLTVKDGAMFFNDYRVTTYDNYFTKFNETHDVNIMKEALRKFLLTYDSKFAGLSAKVVGVVTDN